MNIETIPVGMNATNCYIVDMGNNNAFIIDPGADGEKVMGCIKSKSLNIIGIVLTHGHFDHIGAVDFLKERLDVEVAIHRDDSSFLENAKKNLSYLFNDNIELDSADNLLSDGDNYHSFQVIATPGHTPGGIALYNYKNGILFSGDTIFKRGYGRTDFPGADHEVLFTSINKLLRLPKDTIVYPGHGSTTTIGDFKIYIG